MTELKITRQHVEENGNENVEIHSNSTHEQNMIETTEDKTQTVIINDENDINNESDWQRPISLKGFKKKLNEIFVFK